MALTIEVRTIGLGIFVKPGLVKERGNIMRRAIARFSQRSHTLLGVSRYLFVACQAAARALGDLERQRSAESLTLLILSASRTC